MEHRDYIRKAVLDGPKKLMAIVNHCRTAGDESLDFALTKIICGKLEETGEVQIKDEVVYATEHLAVEVEAILDPDPPVRGHDYDRKAPRPMQDVPDELTNKLITLPVGESITLPIQGRPSSRQAQWSSRLYGKRFKGWKWSVNIVNDKELRITKRTTRAAEMETAAPVAPPPRIVPPPKPAEVLDGVHTSLQSILRDIDEKIADLQAAKRGLKELYGIA